VSAMRLRPSVRQPEREAAAPPTPASDLLRSYHDLLGELIPIANGSCSRSKEETRDALNALVDRVLRDGKRPGLREYVADMGLER
jgi:hypothetical protein